MSVTCIEDWLAAVVEDTWSRVQVELPAWQRRILSAELEHFAAVAFSRAVRARGEGRDPAVDPDLVESMLGNFSRQLGWEEADCAAFVRRVYRDVGEGRLRLVPGSLEAPFDA